MNFILEILKDLTYVVIRASDHGISTLKIDDDDDFKELLEKQKEEELKEWIENEKNAKHLTF